MERLLKHFDPDLVDWLMEKFRAIGVDVETRTTVEAIEKMDAGFAVRVSSGGNSSTLEADLVVHAAGRAPALELLDLDAAGVAVENGRLKLNEFLQSVSNPAVYAAGDAAQAGPPLTPVSSHDAKVVVANLLEGNRHRPHYLGVPSVAFTIPPIAAIGLSEAQARERGLRFRVQSQKASDWYTARRVAEPTYGFKVLVEEPSERILGAHLVGPHADEVINLFRVSNPQRTDDREPEDDDLRLPNWRLGHRVHALANRVANGSDGDSQSSLNFSLRKAAEVDCTISHRPSVHVVPNAAVPVRQPLARIVRPSQ